MIDALLFVAIDNLILYMVIINNLLYLYYILYNYVNNKINEFILVVRYS